MGRNVGGSIRSVQRGFSTPSGSATLSVTVSPVNMSKSFLTINGYNINPGVSVIHAMNARLTSKDAISIRSYADTGPAASGYPVAWELVEFY